jgi:hypothetical protein
MIGGDLLVLSRRYAHAGDELGCEDRPHPERAVVARFRSMRSRWNTHPLHVRQLLQGTGWRHLLASWSPLPTSPVCACLSASSCAVLPTVHRVPISWQPPDRRTLRRQRRLLPSARDSPGATNSRPLAALPCRCAFVSHVPGGASKCFAWRPSSCPVPASSTVIGLMPASTSPAVVRRGLGREAVRRLRARRSVFARHAHLRPVTAQQPAHDLLVTRHVFGRPRRRCAAGGCVHVHARSARCGLRLRLRAASTLRRASDQLDGTPVLSWLIARIRVACLQCTRTVVCESSPSDRPAIFLEPRHRRV